MGIATELSSSLLVIGILWALLYFYSVTAVRLLTYIETTIAINIPTKASVPNWPLQGPAVIQQSVLWDIRCVQGITFLTQCFAVLKSVLRHPNVLVCYLVLTWCYRCLCHLCTATPWPEIVPDKAMKQSLSFFSFFFALLLFLYPLRPVWFQKIFIKIKHPFFSPWIATVKAIFQAAIMACQKLVVWVTFGL